MAVCQSFGELGCVRAPAWSWTWSFPAQEGGRTESQRQPSGTRFSFLCLQSRVELSCPHQDTVSSQSPWSLWSLPMRCRDPTSTSALPKLPLQQLPPSMAHEGCSRPIWATAQEGQCPCLFANAPCTKDTLLAKNSLWVYMCRLNKPWSF